MNAHAEPINRLFVGFSLAQPVAPERRFSDDAFLIGELVAVPLALVATYFLSGSLHLAICVCAVAYAIASFGAGRVRTARRRAALLATAAVVLGPHDVESDQVSRNLILRLDHHHGAVARVQMWIVPSVAMFVGLCYAYVYAGAAESAKAIVLNLVGFALLGVVGAAVLQFQSLRQLRKLTARIDRAQQFPGARPS